MAKTKYPVIDGQKECGRCHKNLLITEYSKYGKYYSYACRSCLNVYYKQYRSTDKAKSRMREYHKEYRKTNRDKLNKKVRDWRKTDTGRASRNRGRRNWTLNEKRKSIAYKGGRCQVCGYNRCEAALDFHHIDPKDKIVIKDHWTFERSKSELDKCVLLCCRCHRELHMGIIKITDAKT